MTQPLSLEPAFSTLLDAALAEDLAGGDVTSRLLVPETARGNGDIVAREATVVSGLFLAAAGFQRLDPESRFEAQVQAGERVAAGTVLARVSGRLRALLSAERTALNLLQRACGIAAATRHCVDAILAAGAQSRAGRPVQVLDTRKTAPGLRALDKLAVRDGGGLNHRYGLGDMVLVKDNHVAMVGSATEALRRALDGAGHSRPVEIEVDSLTQLQELLAQPRLPSAVLLDNFSVTDVAAAVALVAGRVYVEVSGGVTAATLASYAGAGPDGISLGALTHSVRAADIAFDFAAQAGAAAP